MNRIVKKFCKLFDKHQKKKIVLLSIMMVIGAALEVLSISLIIPLVSGIMQPEIIYENKKIEGFCRVFTIKSHESFIFVMIIAMIFIFIGKNLFLILQYHLQYRFVYNNRFAMQKRLLKAYINRPYEYFLGLSSGEMIRVINADTGHAFNLLITVLSFFSEFVVAAALLITIFVIEPFMTLFVAGIMALLVLVIAKVIKPILQKAGIALQKNTALANQWLLQVANGIKEIKVTGKEYFFEENYEHFGKGIINAEKKNAVFSQMPRMLIEMISMSSILVVIGIMLYYGAEIESLIPALAAFGMAAVKLMPSANRIISALNAVAFEEPALDKMLEHVKFLKETEQGENTIKKGNAVHKNLPLKTEISLNNIDFSYENSEKQVLRNASIKIPIGTTVGLVGVSGAGKTTVVDILLGLLTPQKGKILSDGIDVSENYGEWLSHIGYIPQMIFMLDDSIRNNVAFGLRKDEIDDAAVWRALEEAQLAEFVCHLPEQLDTVIGERGVRLSGGQRQRIGIARALYNNPDILILDEATSALDIDTEAAVMEAIHKLHGKKTMIIIAHRLQTIQGCDLIYRVEEQRITQDK